MAGEGETKRKGGIAIDFDKLLGKDDEPLPQLQIVGAVNKDMVLTDEESDAQTENHDRGLSDKELLEAIARHAKLLKTYKLIDGGEKLRVRLRKLEAERERRSRQKEDYKCKRMKTLAHESTCEGVTNDLSHPEAQPSKTSSEFALLFCSKMGNEKGTACFNEELDTLNRSDPKNIREHTPFSTQFKKNKDFSSREVQFKSPTHLSTNINGQTRTNRKQQGVHAYDALSQPSDKDASCCLTKKESGACRPLRLNSRKNNRKTVVLDLEDEEELEEHDVDVVHEADQMDQSKKTRIYYPSRDDPVAIEICYSDLECLAPESYLSSPIMNFYIRYMQKPTSPRDRRRRDCHIFNTYFYEKLKQEGLTKTDKEASFVKFRRWWKGVNIFEKAYIFLPIHENVHWSLVIICMPNKENESGPTKKDESTPIILHLDSLGLHSSKSIFGNVKSFLIGEWNFLRQVETLAKPPIADDIWNKLSRRIDEKVIQVPQQKNDYDCGLFVLYFMERFLEEAPERLKKQDLEMFGRQWFRPEEASGLRRKIRDLLREEFKNANEDAHEIDS